jgi:hypothetical protein
LSIKPLNAPWSIPLGITSAFNPNESTSKFTVGVSCTVMSPVSCCPLIAKLIEYVSNTVIGNLNISGNLQSKKLNLTADTNQIVFHSDSTMKTYLQDSAILTGDKYLTLPNLNGTLATNVVAGGGTGATTFNARGVIVGGITTTGELSSIATTASAGKVLTNIGSASYPAWSTVIFPYSAVTAGQIMYGTALNTIGGSSSFTWSSGALISSGTSSSYRLADADIGADDMDLTNNANKFNLVWKDSTVNVFEAGSSGAVTLSAEGQNTQTDGHLVVGSGTAGTNYTMIFNGASADGTFTWYPDVRVLKFDQSLNVTDNIRATDILARNINITGNLFGVNSNSTIHDLNATGTVNSLESYKINGVVGLTVNYTVVCDVDLIGLTKKYQNFTVTGGLIVGNTSCA